MSTVQQFLDDLIVSLPQLHAIIVTDEDGVSVLSAQSSEDIDNDNVKFSSLYHTTAAQTSKLGIGTNKFMVAYYTTHSLIQFAVSPLVVTLITAPATSSSTSSLPVNIGIIIDAIPNIKLNLQPVAQHLSAR